MVHEHRRVKRVRVLMPFVWHLERLEWAGAGELIDVSLEGARLRLDAVSTPRPGELLTLVAPDLAILPAEAAVRWHRRLHTRVESYLCGVQFVDAHQAWAAWIAAAAVRVRGLDR